MSYLVETHNLTKRFPLARGYRDFLLRPFKNKEVTILKNINLHVEKGELFGLLGPNGAGKTTLIKILCTLVLPTSGRAFINGLDVTRHERKIKSLIGHVISDERSFYWRLTGRQNLNFFAKLNNLSNREVKSRVNELLEYLDLSHHADRTFKDYSKGMRQKLAIIRALLTEPKIILMDEPSNGLDPTSSKKLHKFVKEILVEEEKKTVVFATHNLPEVEELCSRIAIISKGEIKAIGTLEEIRKRFDSKKVYRINLDNSKSMVLKILADLKPIDQFIVGSNNSRYNHSYVGVEVVESNGNIHKLIKEILVRGGEVSSFYEKQVSLSELFEKIVAEEPRECDIN